MTSSITRNAETLTAAQRAMKDVRTEPQANQWVANYYDAVSQFDQTEADAMHQAIVKRLARPS